MNFQDINNLVSKYGSITQAALSCGMRVETLRQMYHREKDTWSKREKTYVVIPDSHAKPGVPNDRYRWAGRLCADVGADVVVDIGDWNDMPSLCSYDMGKKSFEGRRYKNDVGAGLDAKEQFEIGLGNFKPERKEALEGNHEHRIERVVQEHPELDGLLTLEDLGYKEFGWNLSRMSIPLVMDDIAFCHYFSSGVMGRPIGGDHHASNLINKCHMSCVCGHSHLVDYAERTRVDGKKLSGLVVGCYFSQKEDYANVQVNNMWRRGIFVLRNVKDGQFDYEFISIQEMERRYK